MRYYVVSDIHGFHSQLIAALNQAGFFADQQPHKLIVLGDLFDRGKEAKELEAFISDLMDKDLVILIRGNHEDLYEDLVTVDKGIGLNHHISNGTYDTALQLSGFDPVIATIRHYDFAEAAQQTPYYQKTSLQCVISTRRNTMSSYMAGFLVSESAIGIVTSVIGAKHLMTYGKMPAG